MLRREVAHYDRIKRRQQWDLSHNEPKCCLSPSPHLSVLPILHLNSSSSQQLSPPHPFPSVLSSYSFLAFCAAFQSVNRLPSRFLPLHSHCVLVNTACQTTKDELICTPLHHIFPAYISLCVFPSLQYLAPLTLSPLIDSLESSTVPVFSNASASFSLLPLTPFLHLHHLPLSLTLSLMNPIIWESHLSVQACGCVWALHLSKAHTDLIQT